MAIRRVDKPAGAMSPADRLLKTFVDRDLDAFGRLAADLVRSGRQGVLDMALRKCKSRHDFDVMLAFRKAIMVVAQERVLRSGVEAAFITLPAAVLPSAVADLDVIAAAVAECGFFPSWSKATIIPSWRKITDIAGLPFCDVYRSIEAMADGAVPAKPPAASAAEIAGGGFMGMIGVQVGSRPEELTRGLTFDEIEAADRVERERGLAAFDAWKTGHRHKLQGIVLINPTSPSRITADVSALLSEVETIAAEHTDGPAEAAMP